MGWKQVTSETEGRKMTSDMTNTDTDTDTPKNVGASSVSPEHLSFVREVGSFPFSINKLETLDISFVCNLSSTTCI